MKKTIQVVIGLVFNSRREILLAWRDEHKSPGNCWEFPGGKIEAGETGYHALCRELAEEIGIEVQNAENFPSICHEYESVKVILHPWRVHRYQGIPRGAEGQKICWVPLNQLQKFTLPAANHAIVELLLLHEHPSFIE